MKRNGSMKDWNELRANPERWAAYLRHVEKRGKQMDREYLRKWKAIGGKVVGSKPVVFAEANFTLPELVLYTSIPKSYWLNLLKRGVLKSLRFSEVNAFLDSKTVHAIKPGVTAPSASTKIEERKAA